MTNSHYILSVKDLSIVFKNSSFKALDKVSLNLEEGECTPCRRIRLGKIAHIYGCYGFVAQKCNHRVREDFF